MRTPLGRSQVLIDGELGSPWWSCDAIGAPHRTDGPRVIPPTFRRGRGRALSAEVNDHAIRIVEREDAVRLDILGVENDTRRVLRMTAEANLTNDIVGVGQRLVAQPWRHVRSAQIKEDSLRIVQLFLLEEQFPVHLEADADAIGKRRPGNTTKRHDTTGCGQGSRVGFRGLRSYAWRRRQFGRARDSGRSCP